MIRKFFAITLSASLALSTLTVTPARADRDVAKVLGGVAALLLLNEALNNRNDGRVVTRSTTNRGVTVRRNNRRVVKVAPQHCLRNQWTHRGQRQVYGARCLADNAQFAPPQECLRRANTNGGPRRFFTSACLRNHGWRA